MNKLLLIATLVVTTFAMNDEKLAGKKDGKNGPGSRCAVGMCESDDCPKCSTGLTCETEATQQVCAGTCYGVCRSSEPNSAEKCRCLHGTPWPDCDSMRPDEVNICKTCTPGFVRKSDGSMCEESQQSESEIQFKCACKNGKAVADCGRTYRNRCESCNVGFQLNTEDSTCLPKRKCECRNGIPADGKQCTASRPFKCSACPCPFKLSTTHTCVFDQQSTDTCGQETAKCICENGTPAGDGCTKNSRKKCQNCQNDFTLVNNLCEPTKPVCTCANGTPQ
jgi:hypothetical protein